MLSFLLGSSMVLVGAVFAVLMVVVRRHKKHAKVTKWVAFACALIAGSAFALTFLGDWLVALLGLAAGLVGLPPGTIGALALIVVVVIGLDLLDKEPDGAARTLALVAPALLLATGGSLGLLGAEVTNAASGAGAALLSSLVGGL